MTHKTHNTFVDYLGPGLNAWTRNEKLVNAKIAVYEKPGDSPTVCLVAESSHNAAEIPGHSRVITRQAYDERPRDKTQATLWAQEIVGLQSDAIGNK